MLIFAPWTQTIMAMKSHRSVTWYNSFVHTNFNDLVLSIKDLQALSGKLSESPPCIITQKCTLFAGE